MSSAAGTITGQPDDEREADDSDPASVEGRTRVVSPTTNVVSWTMPGRPGGNTVGA